ncbi:MAG: hypothetical protein ACM3ML_37580 [Micromonosporaceae bacterium]
MRGPVDLRDGVPLHQDDPSAAEVVLRSKKPDGVLQEIWAILAVYQGLRHLICQAARASGADPWLIPFARALRAARARPMARRPFPPERLARALRRVIRKLGARIRKKRPHRPGRPRQLKRGHRRYGTRDAAYGTRPPGTLHIWRVDQAPS